MTNSGWEKGNKKLEKGGPNLFIRGTMNQVKWIIDPVTKSSPRCQLNCYDSHGTL